MLKKSNFLKTKITLMYITEFAIGKRGKRMDDRKKLNKLAFWPALVGLVIFLAAGVIFQEQVGELLNTILYGMADKVGWFFQIAVILVIILTFVFAFSKFGNIRIGGPDAKPDYKTWNWITMSLCGGIGTGLLFWAMAEPIYHFMTPPVAAGVEAGSREAAIFAVSQTMWQWSVPQYCLYTICAVAFALVTYNMKKKLSFGPVLTTGIGKKGAKIETFVHAVVIFCLCGAVANSMGVGLMQIGAGVESITGYPQSSMIWLVVAVIIGIVFISSSVSGIGNGLKKLSSFTTIVFIGILIYVTIMGPAGFCANLGTEAFANLLDHPFEKTAILSTMAEGDSWPADWIIQYWASFIVYAPILGMFLSRMAKGRTVRQFILVNVLAPSIFCMIWIAVFGGLTINLQTTGAFDIWEGVNTTGMQSTIFYILNTFPLGKILIVVFVISIFTSFATMADPVAAALATISTRGLSVDDEAPNKLKIVIGVIMCAMAYILVASGGVNAIKGMWNIVGFPIAFLMFVVIISAFKNASKCLKNKDNLVEEEEEME